MLNQRLSVKKKGNRFLAPGIGTTISVLLFIVTLDLGSELPILMVLENQLRWA